MKTRSLSLLLGVAFAALSFAADITGKWTAKVPGRNGDQETTFTFTQQGEKLTGSMTARQGERPIAEGSVTGDAVSFIVESQRGKQTYKGTIAGAEIKFKRESGQGEPREFTAKKAQ